MNKRLLDFLGMLLVGDGILSMAEPKRHCLLWEVGPKPCRDLADEFAENPSMTRWVGLIETLCGLWLASRQQPELIQKITHA